MQNVKISEVSVLPNYCLRIVFEDGVDGIVDLSDLVEIGVFKPLKNVTLFSKVYATDFSIAWNEDLEIDILNVYSELSEKSPKDAFDSFRNYATN